MDRLDAHGVQVAVPRGWEAEMALLEDPAALDARLGPLSAEPRVLVHAANFALPPGRGDYGSGAVEAMDANGILVVVLEFDRASARTALFAHVGVPTDLRPEEFDPEGLQRPIRNQSGTQRFFHVGDRAFCLYVVLGSHALRHVLVPEANRIVAGLRIA